MIHGDPIRICIVGNSKNEHNRLIPRADELWTFLSAAKKDKELAEKATFVWDCHGSIVSQPTRKAVKGSMVRIIDIRRPQFYKNELSTIRRDFQGRFSNQLCWMLGLAYQLSRENDIELIIHRCVFIDQEYQREVPLVQWWLGNLHQAKIPIFIDSSSTLELPQNYGLE